MTTVRARATPLLVTTSWDDGHKLDLNLAERLARHGLIGTFYVSPRNRELRAPDRLSRSDVRVLATAHEIGSHTLSHPRLTELPRREAEHEIVAGKQEVEDIVGAEVSSFAYPGGYFQETHVEAVRAAGCTVGRTVERWKYHYEASCLRVGTTVHAYRHLRDVLPVLRHSRGRPRRAATMFAHWDEVAIQLFDEAYARGDVFHLWGHSWEIDQNDDWNRLERVFAHIARRPDAVYGPNRLLAQTETGG